MAGSAVDAVWKQMQERGVEFVFAQFVDMYARPSAKLVPVRSKEDLEGLASDGAGFAGFAAGEIGQVPSDPDIAAIPDLDTYTPVPWQENLARFACDVTVEGEEWPYCPRTILRRVLAQAREKGYEFKMGLELEYFLVTQRDDGSIEIADRYDTLEKPCYDIAGLTRRYDFLTTVSRYCNDLGWGNYANDHEDANGQFEQNFTYDDALVSCDRAVFFRYMVHTLAEQHGMIATFMPKPFSELTGNGCHFHMSLWDGDTNLFLDESDPRGLGLSETAYKFVGGLKKHARAYSALTAPTVNSYKRLKVGTTAERGDVGAGVDLVRLQQPDADAPHPWPRTCRGPDGRRLVQPVPCGGGRARGRSRRDRERARGRGAEHGQPLHDRIRRAEVARARDPAGQPARSDARARGVPGAQEGARARARRGLRRLLHPREARGVGSLPRAGDAVGAPRVPDPVLRHMEVFSI